MQDLHAQIPPYHPDLFADGNTRHFDDDIPNKPLTIPATGNSKGPLLRNKTHDAHLLEIRKK